MSIPRQTSGWCVIGFAINLALAATAMAAQVTLSVQETAAPASQTVQIPINAEVTAAAAAMQMDLLFDPKVLVFKQIRNGPLLASALVEANVATPGQLRIALTGNEAIKGTGTLLNVEFEVQPGKPTVVELRLDQARAWDHANTLAMTVAAGDGSFSRTGSGVLLWVYVAGGVAVLVALLVVITRRRKGTQQPAGAPQEKKAGRFCAACGAPAPENAKFCTACGARL
jgi:hypothetical protein